MRSLPTLFLMVILVQLAFSATFPVATEEGAACGNNVGGCNLDESEQCCAGSKCKYNGFMSWLFGKSCTANTATCDFKIDNSRQNHPCHFVPTQDGKKFLTAMKSAGCTGFKNNNYDDYLFYSESLFNNLNIQYALKEDDTNLKSWIYFTSMSLSLSCSEAPDFQDLKNLGSYFTTFRLNQINVHMDINDIIKHIPSTVTTIAINLPSYQSSNITGVLDWSKIPSSVTSLTITNTHITGFTGSPSSNLHLKTLDLSNNRIRCNINNDNACNKIATLAGSSSVTVKISNNHFYGVYNPASSNCNFAGNNCLSSYTCTSLSHKTLADYEAGDSFDKCFCSEFSSQSCNNFNGCEYLSNHCKNVNYCKNKNSASACFAGTDCGWCGHSCQDMSTNCPDCSTYNKFCGMGSNFDALLLPLLPSEKPCTGNIDNYKSIAADKKCHQNKLGNKSKDPVECCGTVSSCKNCTNFFSNCSSYGCEKCSDSTMCFDPSAGSNEASSCSECVTWDTKSKCEADGHDCKWWSQTEIVFEQSACTQSTSCTWNNNLKYGKRVHNFCANSGANIIDCVNVNKSSSDQEQNACPVKCTDGDPDQPNELRFNNNYNSGTCVWCGSHFASDYSNCPDCIEYKGAQDCGKGHDANSKENSCFWCGNGACRSSAEFCPNCDSYTTNTCTGSTRCKLCSVQGLCILSTSKCSTINESFISKLNELVLGIDGVELVNDENYNDKQMYCKLKTKSVSVSCNQEYDAIDTITLHGDNIELEKLSPLYSIQAARIVIKDVSLKTASVSDVLSLFNPTYAPGALILSGLGLSGNLTYNTNNEQILAALNHLDISNNSLNGTVPNVFKLIPTFILSGNLFEGTIDNCNRIANNCFVDSNCDWKSNLNPKCDCSQFDSDKDSCKEIPFCSYEKEDTVTKDGKEYDVYICINKAIDTSENKLPTYAYVLIGVAAAIVVIAIIVVAVLLTKRHSSYSSSSSSSTVFEAELDSKTGAEVTF